MKRFVVLAAVLLLALPTFIHAAAQESVTLPEPTGPYAVGRTALYLIDESRPETFTAEPDDKRELALTVWYPADPDPNAALAPWFEPDLAAAIADVYGIPDASVFDLVQVNALAGVPVSEAEDSFPVLIMSHGGDQSHPVLYTSTAEDLASHGYIVLGLAHTYNALTTVFPDGRVLDNLPEASALYVPPADASLFDQIHGMWEHAQSILDITTRDALFVVDQLDTINSGDPILAGRLDLTRIGMFGHSFGGATTVDAMVQDTRIKAGAVLDGSLWRIYENGVPNPILFLAEEGAAVTAPMEAIPPAQLEAAGISQEQYEQLKAELDAGYTAYINSANAYSIMINGTLHLNFGDNGLLVPVFPTLNQDLGSIDPARALRIIDDSLIAFFGNTLKGETNDLVPDPALTPEVVFSAQ